MSNWPHVIRSRLRGAGMFSVGLALLGVVLLFNVAKLGLLLWAASVAAVGTYVAYWAGRTIIRRRMSTATPDERPALMIARALIAIGVLVAMAIVAGCSAQASTVPMDWRMRASLKSALKDAWGLRGSDYMSLSAAQIQQESGWRPDAVSKYAIGLAQFTPATADWIANRYRDMLWPADPSRPAWSITAMTLYDRDLYKPLSWARNSCDRWAFALSAYNGGPAWINRDRAECKKHSGCDDRRWFGEVEKYSARSTSAAHENRHYVSRVLHVLTPQYTAAGYGGGSDMRGITWTGKAAAYGWSYLRRLFPLLCLGTTSAEKLRLRWKPSSRCACSKIRTGRSRVRKSRVLDYAKRKLCVSAPLHVRPLAMAVAILSISGIGLAGCTALKIRQCLPAPLELTKPSPRPLISLPVNASEAQIIAQGLTPVYWWGWENQQKLNLIRAFEAPCHED